MKLFNHGAYWGRYIQFLSFSEARRFIIAGAMFAALFASVLASAAEPYPSIERLVSLPTLSGTPPSNPSWSPNGEQVAFLWNNSGFLFRDLWVAGVDGTKPRRLTELATSDIVESEFEARNVSGLSLSELEKQSARRHARGISEFIWDEVGEQIYFSYQGRIHTVSVTSGEINTLIEQPGGKSSLALSPDRKFLAFLQDGDIWLYRFEGEFLSQATDIGAPGIGSVPIGAYNAADREFRSLSWSPNSRYIALDYIDRRDVHRMPVPSYLHDEPIMHEVRRSYPGDEGIIRKVGVYDTTDGLVRFVKLDDPKRRTIIGLEWSPVASEVLIEQDSYDGEHRWITVASVEDNYALREVLHDYRPRRIYSMFKSAWSSDGKRIFYIGDGEDFYRLYSVRADGSQPRVMTRGDFDVSGSTLTVSKQTNDIFFTSSEESPYESHVYSMPEQGGSARKITKIAGTHTDGTLSPDGSYLATISSNDTTPGELYIVSTRQSQSETQRLTSSPLPEFNKLDLVEPHYVSFPSRIDDFKLHARIITPRNMDPDKKYPVIIGNIYSNTARNQWTWPRPVSLVQQKMLADGEYIIVQPDLRGSVGYGVAFREAFQGDWGGGDLHDLHSTVDYLATLPYVDTDRIGIWGNSYGGMMVLFALFERPGMFAAGVAGSPAIDVNYFTQNDQHLSRRPQTHPEIFLNSTLLNYGDKLEDPLLFIHGLHDDIVPWKTTAEMIEKLMFLGKDFDMIVPPQSAHWWAYPEHYAVFTFRKILQYFDLHVGPGGLPRDPDAER